MRPGTTTRLAIAALALMATFPSIAEKLKEGEIACRSESAVLAYEELARSGDALQKNAFIGTACLSFHEDMDVTLVGTSGDNGLVEILITNGRRKIILWTRPESLDARVVASTGP
ncbi:MAG: hypothetical protein AAGE01_19080 [Pseudomonadota bacterium]